MSKNPKIDLIYVFYNNKESALFLKKQIINFSHILENIILIDNGSSDGTYEELINQFSLSSNIKIIKIKNNLHYGGAIKAGLRHCNSDFISWMNSDTIISNDFFDKTIKLLSKNSQPFFIKGRRQKRALFEKILSFGLSIYASIVLRFFFYDISAFPTVTSKNMKDFLVSKGLHNYTFELSAYFYAKKSNFQIIRLPVLYEENVQSKSSWNRDLLGYFKMIRIWHIAIKKIGFLKNA
jgi:GT2 family glycosyltransferase